MDANDLSIKDIENLTLEELYIVQDSIICLSELTGNRNYRLKLLVEITEMIKKKENIHHNKDSIK